MPVENDPKQIQYRRCVRNVVISGAAVILFGVWSVVKAAFYFSLNRVDLISLLDLEVASLMNEADIQLYSFMNLLCLLIVLFFLGIDIPIRLYVTYSAVTDARGIKKKSFIYIVLAVIMGIGMITGVVQGIRTSASSEIPEQLSRGMATSAAINLTSFLALFVLTVSSIRLRVLRGKLKEEGKQTHIV